MLNDRTLNEFAVNKMDENEKQQGEERKRGEKNMWMKYTNIFTFKSNEIDAEIGAQATH